ncbi:MAG TPA: hypothetical protein VLZ75_01165 [Chitinophagales bacterium]|nr:hypothetical protein [Chitinophagales bacterium]
MRKYLVCVVVLFLFSSCSKTEECFDCKWTVIEKTNGKVVVDNVDYETMMMFCGYREGRICKDAKEGKLIPNHSSYVISKRVCN